MGKLCKKDNKNTGRKVKVMRNNKPKRGNRTLKILDKYIGIPVVFLLGFLVKKKNLIPKKIKKIGILKTAAIGDTILLSAIVKDIKDRLPESEVVLFVGSSNFEIAKLISKKYKNVKVKKISIKNIKKTVKTVREEDFDIWMDFGSWPRFNALISFFAKSKLKVGFKTRGQFRHYIYDKTVIHRDDLHEIYNYKNILKAVGLNGDNLPDLGRNKSISQKNCIVIHMFPGGYKSYLREWPEEYWIKLINNLTKKGYEVLLSGAKSDEKKAFDLYRKIKNKEKVKIIAGKADLEKLIDILQSCFCVISVNTGIMHLASALKCNLIALHGPTSYKRWGPLNENSISLASTLSCSPCLNLGFEYGCDENKCMKDITVEKVMQAVEFFEKEKSLIPNKHLYSHL